MRSLSKSKLWQTQGIGHCIALHFAVNTHEELMEQMQMFGEEVIPAFNSGQPS